MSAIDVEKGFPTIGGDDDSNNAAPAGESNKFDNEMMRIIDQMKKEIKEIKDELEKKQPQVSEGANLNEDTKRYIDERIESKLEEEELKGDKLSEDTYSLMKVDARWESLLISWFVWIIQMGLYAMILWELIEKPERFGTEFNIPFRTSTSTSIGQSIAFLFAIAEVPDLFTWSRAKDKYGKQLKTSYADIPNVLQHIMGLFALGISCILILQSKDLIEVFSNFAAMYIIAQFDNMVFTFCLMGIFNKRIKEDAETVSSSYKDDKMESEITKCMERKGTIAFSRLTIVVSILAMSIGFGFVCFNQSNESYFEQKYPNCNVPTEGNVTLKNFGDGKCDTTRAVMNNYQCNFEGGDCVSFNTAFPNCSATSPFEVGDGKCQADLDIEDCGWDGGDCCPWLVDETKKEKYEKYYGDDTCHAIFNTPKCLYDNGDCLSYNMGYENLELPENTTAFDFDIDDTEPIVLGDGNCTLAKEYMEEYMNEENGWVFGDCEDKVILNNTKRSKYPHCRQQDLFKIGNGKCDTGFLFESCGWDELDCCELDKAKAKDGKCDRGDYLTKECGYDGYDCCGDDSKTDLNNQQCGGPIIFNRPFIREYQPCGYDDFDCEQASAPGFDKCVVPDHDLLGNGICDGDDYDSKECNWDDGDCEELHRLYPYCSDTSSLNNGKCENTVPANTMACGYDGGDCIEFNAKYSNCKTSDAYLVGDGFCHQDFNTSACGFDGGDCIGVENEFNRKYPNCQVSKPFLVGNGKCDRRVDNYDYNTRECGWDGGDCLSSNAEGGCDEKQFLEVENGECNEESNTYGCKWDGGDCLPGCNLHDSNIGHIGNGKCEKELNTPECLFDRGDCLENCAPYNKGFHYPYLGDGKCNDKIGYDTAECLWDLGDCLRETGCEFKNHELHLIGDGHCDEQFNTKECQLDKGDCA